MRDLASQVKSLLDDSKGLSQADRDELLHLIQEAESLASGPAATDRSTKSQVSEEQQRADDLAAQDTDKTSRTTSGEADTVRGESAADKSGQSSDQNKAKTTDKTKSDK